MGLLRAIQRTLDRHRAIEGLLEVQDGPRARIETGFRPTERR